MVWACVHSVNSTSHTSFGSTKIASGLGGLLENGFVSRHSGVSRVSSLFSVASVNPVPSSFHYAFIILALCFLCCGAWNAPLYDQRTGRKGYSRPPDSRTQTGARLGARSIGRGKLLTSYLHWSH